jgi:hypothetical protein
MEDTQAASKQNAEIATPVRKIVGAIAASRVHAAWPLRAIVVRAQV